jgi:predicted RNA binding protein YcfA (HicA-like mRNA interferase family)
MPRFGSIKRRDLILAMRRAGFGGPASGGSHQVMWKGELKISIPNPHRGDIGKNLLALILREAGISRQQWEQL